MSERDFGELLTEGIRYVCAREHKPMQIVQDELGYAVGHQGSSVIRYWRQGHLPSKPSEVETLARVIVQRGHVSRGWLERFMFSANFSDAVGLCDELFPNRHHQLLPSPPTQLIGREREVADLMERLQSDHVRLLTLTGPPGVGKTRLALHLAAALLSAFEDGVVFVPLVSARDPELVVSVVASAMGLMDDDGQSLKARLISSLQDRELLLVLDNFEHVITAAAYVAELVSGAPHSKVIVTSREPLHIYGEYEYLVQPLQLPVAEEHIRLEIFSGISSVQLFVERATAANPNFRLDDENAEAIAAICMRLDGLPLAIELAASRSKWRTPRGLLTQLNDRSTLLVSGPRDWPIRQQTLQAAIDWSYALLSDAEQRLFRWLSVFQGGCTIEAVEMACRPFDVSARHQAEVNVLRLLESLQDKSLLQSASSSNGAPDEFRYSMLETIHEYANYKLHEAGEAGEAQQRHLAWCLQLAEQARQNLRGPDQLLWLKRLDREVNNIRKALSCCVEHPVDIESGLRIAADLRWFWQLRSRIAEGCTWLDRLLAIDLPVGALHSTQQARAQAMYVASLLHGFQQNPVSAMELALGSLKLFSEIGDTSGTIPAKIALAAAIRRNGDIRQGAALAEEILLLCRANGDRFDEAELLDGPLSAAAFAQGDYARAAALHEQSLKLRRALRDTDGEAWSIFLLAGNVRALGNMVRARTLYEESCALWWQLGNWRRYADVLAELGRLVREQGDYAQAKALFEESLNAAQRIYDRYRAARAWCDLGMVACEEGDHTRAQASLRQIAASVQEQRDTPLPALFFIMAIRLASQTGSWEYAARLAGATQTALRKTNPHPGTSDRFEYEAVLSVIRLALRQEVFERTCAEGLAMSLEAAITYATDEALS